jgi:hypothetical protein
MNAQGTLPELYRIMEGLEYLLHRSQIKRREVWNAIAAMAYGFSLILIGSNLQQLATNGTRCITVHHGASRCITVPHVLQPDPICIILK